MSRGSIAARHSQHLINFETARYVWMFVEACCNIKTKQYPIYDYIDSSVPYKTKSDTS